MRKVVYFIRHGESEQNAKHVRHGPEGHLTEKGKEQVRKTALRFTRIPIDKILSSPYERARESAEIVSAITGKEIEFENLLVERRNPSEIVGKPADDPEVRKIVAVIDQSFHPDGLRYSDEENFDDLKARAGKLLDFLENRPEERLLIVTHSIFLTMVISYMISREALTAEEFAKRTFFNTIGNAGITVAVWSSRDRGGKTHGWKLISWNDDPYVQPHMAEMEG